MSDLQSNTLYNAVRNSGKIQLIQPKEKYICCCINELWCFEHSGLAGIKQYNTESNNCCLCLDCCTWCLEFRFKKSFCKKQTNCYLCCCSIYFA